jgi:hypothetical protein
MDAPVVFQQKRFRFAEQPAEETSKGLADYPAEQKRQADAAVAVEPKRGRHFAEQPAERKADDAAETKGPVDGAVVVEQKDWRFAERPADAAVVVEQKDWHFAERPANAAVVVEKKGQRFAERPADAAVVVEKKGRRFAERPADADVVVVEQKGRRFAEWPAEELAGQKDQKQQGARTARIGAVAAVAADVQQKHFGVAAVHRIVVASELPVLGLLRRLSKQLLLLRRLCKCATKTRKGNSKSCRGLSSRSNRPHHIGLVLGQPKVGLLDRKELKFEHYHVTVGDHEIPSIAKRVIKCVFACKWQPDGDLVLQSRHQVSTI